MAVQRDLMAEAGPGVVGVQPRRAVLSPEMIAILAVGVALSGVVLTMTMVLADVFSRGLGAVREDVREFRAGQVEVRERLVRVEVGQDDLRARMIGLETGQAELRARQIEFGDRMTRVEAKVDMLLGDEPPERSAGTAG